MGYPDAELSIVFVDDCAMRELNRDFRGKDTPTNVISFSMTEGQFGEINPELLGDVVISTETAVREAARWEMAVDDRILQLLIHGMLHLLGYDHEKGDKEALDMEQKSNDLFKLVSPATDLTGWLGDSAI